MQIQISWLLQKPSGSTLFAKTGHVVFSKRRVKCVCYTGPELCMPRCICTSFKYTMQSLLNTQGRCPSPIATGALLLTISRGISLALPLCLFSSCLFEVLFWFVIYEITTQNSTSNKQELCKYCDCAFACFSIFFFFCLSFHKDPTG